MEIRTNTLFKIFRQFQCFTKTTTTTHYSSSAATPKPRKQLDEEKLNHEDRVVNITKLTVEHLHPDKTKLEQFQLQNERLTEAIEATTVDLTKPKVVKKKEELPWRITPTPGNLVNHYMMLSKIRLTCELLKLRTESLNSRFVLF